MLTLAHTPEGLQSHGWNRRKPATGVAVPQFSAQESALGYLYQARYALWLLLDGPEERETVLESLDDITFEQSGTVSDLLQTKHHTVAASLTDASPELWKTVRIWSTYIKNGTVLVPPVTLTLITTSIAPPDSIAARLRQDSGRNATEALGRLLQVSQDSSNRNLASSFSAFTALSHQQQQELVNGITIVDNSPPILTVADRIRDRIRPAVDRQYRDGLYERLEGWWFGRIIEQLKSPKPLPISGFEVYDKMRSIAEQFAPEALPIDYLDARPGSLDPAGDNRMFVKQLRAIDVGIPRIEKAILDYYRAFEQRSRWAREELLIGDEVELYEIRLVDEWQRFSLAITEELGSEVGELELKKAGRQVFNWMEQNADVRIRPNVTEPYVMRGSFHLLADAPTPRVWWHPAFVQRLKQILPTEQSVVS